MSQPASTTPPPPDSSSPNLDPAQLVGGEGPPPATAAAPDNNPAASPATKALHGKKLSLEARNASLRAQIEEVRAKRDEVKSQLRTQDAAATVKKHIRLLHDYNEIRDVGTGLMGMIADSRGVRVRDIYAEFGVEVKD
ncbi:MAG: hypothetical protein M1839_005064 [Geoglossum umbratile]|nr:MAG: hypothetical protein M1839_005064 [Geoglossum umbratile]